MAYFCFIECEVLTVPNMQLLVAENPDTAMAEASADYSAKSRAASGIIVSRRRASSVRSG